jgi:hypothetical protein
MKVIDLVLTESLRLARAGSRFPVGARRFATSPGNTSGQRHVYRRAAVNSFDRSICSEAHRFDPSPFDGTTAREQIRRPPRAVVT